MFKLHKTLEADLVYLGDFDLTQVFLLPDSDNPWIVLVPRKEDITEIHQLSTEDQSLLIKEISYVSKKLETLYEPDKLNIGALGNMVPQLHIHIICRFTNDKAWPGAIWGNSWGNDQVKIESFVTKLKKELF